MIEYRLVSACGLRRIVTAYSKLQATEWFYALLNKSFCYIKPKRFNFTK